MDTRTEYRVSFTIWPPGDLQAREVERITTDRDDALDQLGGLQGMQADHELRPCGDHVWRPKMEQRQVQVGDWAELT